MAGRARVREERSETSAGRVTIRIDHLELGGASADLGDLLIIFLNDDTGALVLALAGFAEGALVAAGGG